MILFAKGFFAPRLLPLADGRMSLFHPGRSYLIKDIFPINMFYELDWQLIFSAFVDPDIETPLDQSLGVLEKRKLRSEVIKRVIGAQHMYKLNVLWLFLNFREGRKPTDFCW
ncbi:hypothetical protein ONS95_005160 [Cadophora gregata]|uniref:uncharacterized protein n=1 Tax=Cadophora gregata TaxID=51156 RepID=UPI0026DD94B1|nr:uncharacterized protein ONS95_005160 [Cadophora gregata]KAK0104895.1 hypothetical protein ONS95_005160 [Cadophora gregata]KAK0115026.1 hypothetical protein ONS96_013496 [Cadophora gregata f. sp. sojae]